MNNSNKVISAVFLVTLAYIVKPQKKPKMRIRKHKLNKFFIKYPKLEFLFYLTLAIGVTGAIIHIVKGLL